MSSIPRKRVVVVSGGWSHEANYSSAVFVMEALQALGHEAVLLRYEKPTFLAELLAARPDVIFPQALGAYGEDGTLQGLLDVLDIPYLGSGVCASAVGMNKALFKTVIRGMGLEQVTVPNALTLSLRQLKQRKQLWPTYHQMVAQLGSPFVLKPLSSGASFGLHVIDNEAALDTHLAPTLAEFRVVLLEQYIEGREFALGVLEDDQQSFDLPVCEIHAAGRVFTQHAKCQPASSVIPALLDQGTTQRLQAVGRTLFSELGCRSFARVDVLVATDGTISVLELNTLPGLIPGLSSYPKMCEASGISYQRMIQMLLQSASRPHPSQMAKVRNPPPAPLMVSEGRSVQ